MSGIRDKNIRITGRFGFTLIELMIVVAIIGILSAIAYPSYQNYVKRAHVAEGLTLAQSMKVAVAEYHATHGDFPDTNSEAGVESISGNAVTSVVIGTDGIIIITYNNKVHPTKNIIGLRPAYVPTQGSITWFCRGPTTGSQQVTRNIVDSEYLPVECRSRYQAYETPPKGVAAGGAVNPI